MALFNPIPSVAEQSLLPVTAANDNRTPAGNLKDGILNVRLELRQARWYPEAADGVHEDVYAFTEEGHQPQSPGPLLRVPHGTGIHASLHNLLPLAAKVYGLHSYPGDPNQAVHLAVGETREVQFDAGEPGTVRRNRTHFPRLPRGQRPTRLGASAHRHRSLQCERHG